MRQDPHLSFLSKCGPPSSSEESALANKTVDGEDNKVLDEDEDRSVHFITRIKTDKKITQW